MQTKTEKEIEKFTGKIGASKATLTGQLSKKIYKRKSRKMNQNDILRV